MEPREIPVGSNHFFGVMVINDNGTPSPASTLIFEVKELPPSSGSGGSVPPVGPSTPQPSNEKISITVKFDSITVHEKHEGFGEGDGEYSLIAFVQGRPIDLTKYSESGVCGGTSAPPYCGGLWDVANGQTIKFHSDAEVTVGSKELFPLSIFTIGKEVDGCGRMSTDFYSEYQKDVLIPVFNDPRADWR